MALCVLDLPCATWARLGALAQPRAMSAQRPVKWARVCAVQRSSGRTGGCSEALPAACAGGMVEIFLFIIAAGVIAHVIGASIHEGIFVGALVSHPGRNRRCCCGNRPPCVMRCPRTPHEDSARSACLHACLHNACHGRSLRERQWHRVRCGCCRLRVQVSMSSTSIVVKCLTDSKATASPHGQITIGTLILQVPSCASTAPCLHGSRPGVAHEHATAMRCGGALHGRKQLPGSSRPQPGSEPPTRWRGTRALSAGAMQSQDCMVGLLFAFMPILANNRGGGETNHLDVVQLLFRCPPKQAAQAPCMPRRLTVSSCTSARQLRQVLDSPG